MRAHQIRTWQVAFSNGSWISLWLCTTVESQSTLHGMRQTLVNSKPRPRTRPTTVNTSWQWASHVIQTYTQLATQTHMRNTVFQNRARQRSLDSRTQKANRGSRKQVRSMLHFHRTVSILQVSKCLPFLLKSTIHHNTSKL